MEKDTSLQVVCETSVQIDGNNSKHGTNFYEESEEIDRKNTLLVTVVVEDSLVKDTKGWKLSDKNNTVIVKQFS